MVPSNISLTPEKVKLDNDLSFIQNRISNTHQHILLAQQIREFYNASRWTPTRGARVRRILNMVTEMRTRISGIHQADSEGDLSIDRHDQYCDILRQGTISLNAETKQSPGQVEENRRREEEAIRLDRAEIEAAIELRASRAPLHVRSWRQGSPMKSPSRESTPLFVAASGDIPTSTAPGHIHTNEATPVKLVSSSDTAESVDVHEIHNVTEATPTSNNKTPESANGWHPHISEAPILHRIASRCRALLRSTLQAIWLTRPSQDHASAPLEVSYEHRTRSPGKGFCVLSLDGGGCRGYVSLLILKHLLRQLQPDGPIYPYLYFDLICGTSIGGLIAIPLAVLHLDIDTAIDLYVNLVGEVFSDGFSALRYLWKDAGYSREPLERAITRILEVHGGDRTHMEDSARHRDCRCFVTATHCVGESRRVFAVRSYGAPGGVPSFPDGLRWTCWDAALATTAVPGFFQRHSIAKGKHRFNFEDAGAHRVNNPTKFALDECQKLDAADSQLNAMTNSLFISLGTGARGVVSEPEEQGWFGLFQTKIATLRASARYATDVNHVHESMKARVGDSNMAYFRLNPPLGHKIGLGDWEEVPAMEESVARYCELNKAEIQRCADQLDSFQTAERRRPRIKSPSASFSV